MISVDLMIINSASAWLRYLSHRHDIHDVDMFAKEETASDKEAPDDKELTVNSPIDHDLEALSPEPDGKKKSQPSLGWKARLQLQKHQAIYDKRAAKLQKAKLDEVDKKVYHFSSYNELCNLVGLELYRKRLPWFIAISLAWIGIGHPMTVVGRRHWTMVLRKYRIFVGACMGIWTDETVDSYDLEATAKTIFINDDVEANYMQLLYIAVGIRAIFFQIMTIFTFASVMIAALAGSPMFVYSERLRKCLPAMIIWDSWGKAKEKEFQLTGKRRFHNIQWILYLRSFSIRVSESRVSFFITNLLGILVSFVVLIYSEKTKPLVAFFLSLLMPFAIAKALTFVIFIGRGMALTDRDFLHFFNIFAILFTCGMYRIKHPLLAPGAEDNEAEEEEEELEHDAQLSGPLLASPPEQPSERKLSKVFPVTPSSQANLPAKPYPEESKEKERYRAIDELKNKVRDSSESSEDSSFSGKSSSITSTSDFQSVRLDSADSERARSKLLSFDALRQQYGGPVVDHTLDGHASASSMSFTSYSIGSMNSRASASTFSNNKDDSRSESRSSSRKRGGIDKNAYLYVSRQHTSSDDEVARRNDSDSESKSTSAISNSDKHRSESSTSRQSSRSTYSDRDRSRSPSLPPSSRSSRSRSSVSQSDRSSHSHSRSLSPSSWNG
jgi:hypothetical protein